MNRLRKTRIACWALFLVCLFLLELISPDAATCWQMTRYGNSESYWRCLVEFDEEGRLARKSIEWWSD